MTATGGVMGCTNPHNLLQLRTNTPSPVGLASLAANMSGGSFPAMASHHGPHILAHPAGIPDIYQGQIIGPNGNLLTGSGPIQTRFHRMHRHAHDMGWLGKLGARKQMMDAVALGNEGEVKTAV